MGNMIIMITLTMMITVNYHDDIIRISVITFLNLVYIFNDLLVYLVNHETQINITYCTSIVTNIATYIPVLLNIATIATYTQYCDVMCHCGGITYYVAIISVIITYLVYYPVNTLYILQSAAI